MLDKISDFVHSSSPVIDSTLFLFYQFLIVFNYRQYVKDVGEEENYNVKELITSVNATVPSMTEYDVLLVCIPFHKEQGRVVQSLISFN